MANKGLGYDIQTGRNVYVDKDKYESDDAYKAKIDSYVNEGFKLVYGDPDEPSSGGGGGGGAVEPLIVNIVESADTAICDKTAGEIKAALDNGVPAYFKVTSTTEGWSNNIKTVQITSVETEERAGETEGVFDEFTVHFGSTNGTYSTMSNTSLEDALSKYPEIN